MKVLVVLLVAAAAVAVSADVRDALRNSRQAILIQPQQLGLRQVAAQPVFLQQADYQQPLARQPIWRILRQSQDQDPAGFYRFSFETENGIREDEEGTVIRAGSSDESTAKQGNFAYTSPEGVPISLSWVADENGFRAQGAHLPTPPPIPEAILRSLEQNAREEGRQGGFFKK